MVADDARYPLRLRMDFEVATITAKEAAGELVSANDLVWTASCFAELLERPADQRLEGLFQRFLDLSAALIAPGDAPTRLLVALAWHHVRALVAHDVGQASKTLVVILRQLREEHIEQDDYAMMDLYRFVEHLPGGLKRLVVYRHLLELLPYPLSCRTGDDILPGVLVEAIADSETSTHLAGIASRLQTGLDRSPFKSESALLGETAHVFHDVAVVAADRDESVLPRSDRMRRQLLEIAGARV